MLCRSIIVSLSVIVAGCTWMTANFHPTPNAPTAPPASAPPRIVQMVPDRARELGMVEVNGNGWLSAADCERRLVEESRSAARNFC